MPSGRSSVLECVCVCAGFLQDILSYGRGGTPKFGVDVEDIQHITTRAFPFFNFF